MGDDSTPRDPFAAQADALEKALAELEAKKQAAAALAAKYPPQIERNLALENRLAGLSQSDRRKVLDAIGLRHVSAAPRPLVPLRAAGPLTTAKREEAPRKPIAWKLWATVPEVALWEAVALVLDIDPRSLQPLRDGWMAGPGRGPLFEPRSFPSEAKREGFDSALSFAERAAKVAGPIYLRTGLAVGMNKRTAQVSLAEVVAYFVGCDWPDIPAPLLALVPAVTEPTAQAEPSTVPAPVPAVVPPRPTNLLHKPKRRADCLNAVIQMASERAADPTDWPSAWAALVALALQADRPAPLLGYTEGEGVKYQTDNADAAVAWLSRQAFRKRAGRKT